GKGGNTGPLIVTYELPEVIADLNDVMPYDWAKFLHDRIDNINPRADLDGITRGGYKLVYTAKPNHSEQIIDKNATHKRGPNVWYSLGISVSDTGTIADVRWGGPADNAKLHPGQKILAVDGRIFSDDALKSAIDKAQGTTEPIHLILQSDQFVTLADINYHDGQRYPALVRLEGTPDYLDDITTPLAKPQH
ncbi:MAG TPA: PDZ domain-containing protein, partial [Acidobacteriaceae bacterium]|nr:PDZ domain-containing protein [Acidobacteriaceae bacterium]